MTNNSTFISHGNEIDHFMRQVQIDEDPSYLCSVAFHLGDLYGRVYNHYSIGKLTKEEYEDLNNRIKALMHHIRKTAEAKEAEAE